ncbi:MAG: ATP-binding protein, partial [Candidatus Anaerobiospirillum merdipullorum]|nr:ATP-binding protein [Candidatus Anaerobiospirillum merdipullorum]
MEHSTDERFLQTIQTKAGEWKILRRGGFWGPNASGKSSFIESIFFARNYIVTGQKSGKGTGVNQFRGDFADLARCYLFQFMFYLDGEVYEYGFSLDRRQVHEEWLLQLTEKDLAPVFTRVTDQNGKTEIDIEPRFANYQAKDRQLADVLKNSIQEAQKNQLFLYKLYDNGIKQAEQIVHWFKNLQVIFPHTKVQALPLHMKADEELRQYIATMLHKMDTGVYEITVASEEIDFREYAEKLNLPKEIIDDIEEIKNGIVNLCGKYFV